jgi:hypothetical protein
VAIPDWPQNHRPGGHAYPPLMAGRYYRRPPAFPPCTRLPNTQQQPGTQIGRICAAAAISGLPAPKYITAAWRAFFLTLSITQCEAVFDVARCRPTVDSVGRDWSGGRRRARCPVDAANERPRPPLARSRPTWRATSGSCGRPGVIALTPAGPGRDRVEATRSSRAWATPSGRRSGAGARRAGIARASRAGVLTSPGLGRRG